MEKFTALFVGETCRKMQMVFNRLLMSFLVRLAASRTVPVAVCSRDAFWYLLLLEDLLEDLMNIFSSFLGYILREYFLRWWGN